jgi:hypothetical protein
MNLLLLYKGFGPYPFMAIFCDEFNTFEEGVTFTLNGQKQSIIVDWDYSNCISNPAEISVYQKMFIANL